MGDCVRVGEDGEDGRELWEREDAGSARSYGNGFQLAAESSGNVGKLSGILGNPWEWRESHGKLGKVGNLGNLSV
jgi:hypothetical protein